MHHAWARLTSAPAADEAAPSPDRRPGSWQRCGVAAVLLGIAAAAVDVGTRPTTSPLATPASTASLPARQAPVPDAPSPVDLHLFALNALLVPLLDDAEPPRWTDVAIDANCDPDTRVLIDGQPMVVGQLVPATAFTVHWHMAACRPLGRSSVELSGRVELLVFHEDNGLSAVVQPDHLRIDSHLGRTSLHGAFAAETSLSATTVQYSGAKRGRP